MFPNDIKRRRENILVMEEKIREGSWLHLKLMLAGER
jgi:hypothetical protein